MKRFSLGLAAFMFASMLACSLASAAPKIPPAEKLTELANGSLTLFKEGVDKKDFSKLYESMSDIFKSQFTLEKFTESFKSFTDQKIDLTPIDTLKPSLTEDPSLDGDNVLHLVGHYAANDTTVKFKLGYLYNYPNQWKLISIDVDV